MMLLLFQVYLSVLLINFFIASQFFNLNLEICMAQKHAPYQFNVGLNTQASYT